MGMQVLSILGANDPAVLLSHAYSSEGQLLPLSLTPAAASSRLLCDSCLRSGAKSILTTQNVTVNLHHDGVPPTAFALLLAPLLSLWQLSAWVPFSYMPAVALR